jgi:hypothetical protein
MGFFTKKSTPPTDLSKPANPVNLVKDTSGSSAVNLTKVRESGHMDLAKRADKAGIALSKRGLSGIRAQCVLVLDHSGSMHGDFAAQDKPIQRLVERALGFALQVDEDGTIPVIPFDSRVKTAVDVTLSNYQGVVDRDIFRPHQMGTTDLTGALREVKRLAGMTDLPLFVLVVTDGEPNDKNSATAEVCDLARYPAFLKFLALRPVRYLSELDDLGDSRRLLDNVDAKPEVGSNLDLLTCNDLTFADAMADEFDSWLAAAQAKGVIR